MNSDESDFKDFSSDEEDNGILIASKKNQQNDAFSKHITDEDSDDEDLDDEKHKGEEESYSDKLIAEENSESETQKEAAAKATELSELNSDDRTSREIDEDKVKQEKLQRLKKLKAAKKSKHKTGVIYLSKIPPYMKPAKLRQILSRFGEVDRLFLKKEDDQKHKQRVKSGGNKKTSFEEGWAEFIKKKDAKLCASTLNGNIIGGKKGNFYHDDIMNVKYLSGFKWADLTEQIARENDIRQSKLQLEISQANKLNAEFIRNVEKSKMINKIKSKKRGSKAAEENPDIYRTFKQRKVTTSRADGPEELKQKSSKDLDNVLHSLF